MKKMLICTTFLIVLICSSIVTFAMSYNDSEELISIDVSECFELATDFVEDFYKARCLGTEFITSIKIKDQALLSIIDSKIRIRSTSDFGEIDKYAVTITLRDSLVEENLIYLEVVRLFSYQHTGETHRCSDSSVYLFLFEKEGLGDYTLLYWLDASNPDSSLDPGLYKKPDFYTSSIKGLKTWISSFEGYEVYVEYAEEIAEEKEKFFNEKFGVRESRRVLSEDIVEKETLTYSDIKPIRREYGIYHTYSTSNYELLWTDSMIMYASGEFDQVYPQSGSSVIPYFDFYMENSNGVATSWDCTNFISHCLLAGDAEMYNDGTINSWWCSANVSGPGTYSGPWTNVGSLYNFLIRSAVTPGPFANSFYDLGGASNFVMGSTFSLGDIIQKDAYSDGHWDHSLIITGRGFVSGIPDPVPYVVSRTGPGIYSNGKLSSLYLNQNPSYRILRLVGYRTN